MYTQGFATYIRIDVGLAEVEHVGREEWLAVFLEEGLHRFR